MQSTENKLTYRQMDEIRLKENGVSNIREIRSSKHCWLTNALDGLAIEDKIEIIKLCIAETK